MIRLAGWHETGAAARPARAFAPREEQTMSNYAVQTISGTILVRDARDLTDLAAELVEQGYVATEEPLTTGFRAIVIFEANVIAISAEAASAQSSAR